MKEQFQGFQEAMGQLFPMAQQMQQQFQQQFEAMLKAQQADSNPLFNSLTGFNGLGGLNGLNSLEGFASLGGFVPNAAELQNLLSRIGGNAPVNPATLGAIQPFLSSTAKAMQQAFSQISLPALSQVQSEYATELGALLSSIMAQAPAITPEEEHQRATLDKWLEGDRRFSSQEWHDHGPYEVTAALYALNSRYTRKILDLIPEDVAERRQVEYAVEQMISALSPANYFATNPEAQKRLLETKGESLKSALENIVGDLMKGKISQTDDEAFEVGRNVATTPGDIVFENQYFQLIQYKPTTEEVGQRPMLFVPPCINKYYILDLQPENSLVAWLVSQGHTLFLVSWKNPQEEGSHFSWDGYVEEGVLVAIDTVCKISKQPEINVLGFCVGGTLLATALSTLAGRGEEKVHSVTFLTTLLDFSDTGALGVFVTEEQVKAREESIGAGGLMPGKDLASAFSSLRPNDLIWNYVVSNYLKGEKPPAFDLLYWNGDSTNLPGPMFAWYLRNTYLENNLVKPGKAEVAGVPVDLGQIQVPAYILATREDHIVPWTSAYRSTALLGGDSRFVLGASGHIAGVINPAKKNKRNFWVGEGAQPENPEAWFEKAEARPGSWWNDWSAWLEPKKGKLVKAPAKPGNAKYKSIEPAPGRYVKQKA